MNKVIKNIWAILGVTVFIYIYGYAVYDHFTRPSLSEIAQAKAEGKIPDPEVTHKRILPPNEKLVNVFVSYRVYTITRPMYDGEFAEIYNVRDKDNKLIIQIVETTSD